MGAFDQYYNEGIKTLYKVLVPLTEIILYFFIELYPRAFVVYQGFLY